MKLHHFLPLVALGLVSCATPKNTPPASASQPGAAAKAPASGGTDALDDYGDTVVVSDPLEGLNRATFAFNDKFYKWVMTPISKTYTTIFPKPVRKSIDNAYENVKFPVRFVNSGLQGKFGRAGKEAQKFGVNTVAGVGGLFKVSDKIDSLKDVPAEDTGQTLATWGMGHGPYIVVPVMGPTTLREAVGSGGDYVLNPINWGFVFTGDADDWAWIPPTGNTIRAMPGQLDLYKEATANAIDPYTAVRSTYIQNRNAAAEQ
ncbi:MlaA family lipoprotein [Brevifollis gellanilyticus]|uniref:ABC transporter n=1 Tax=Brevifollis gellanilyticus TaxID=748831 RepID=A0A512M968_9BACT|nr:VacJ family lipoprotein [Brevifollis gellanilyticus]GEP43287.1 ABC transporter [Brevifollis gellanilyticus]